MDLDYENSSDHVIKSLIIVEIKLMNHRHTQLIQF